MSLTLPTRGGRKDGPREPVSFRTVLMRPEFTAVVGTLTVFGFFAVFTGSAGFLTAAMTRNYLEVAAEIGIIATPITLLLVAGEFDLSVGSMVAASQVVISYLTVEAGWSLAAALPTAAAIAAGVGLVNGYLVVRTKLPSFIITLATMFMVRGAAQGVLRMLTGTSTIDGIRDAVGATPLAWLFSSSIGPFSISLVWWIAITLVAAWVLDKTAFGNWITPRAATRPPRSAPASRSIASRSCSTSRSRSRPCWWRPSTSSPSTRAAPMPPRGGSSRS